MVKMVLELRHDCDGVSWMGIFSLLQPWLAVMMPPMLATVRADLTMVALSLVSISLSGFLHLLHAVEFGPECLFFLLVSNYGVYVLSQVGPLTLCVAPLGPGGDNALTPENLPGMNAPM